MDIVTLLIWLIVVVGIVAVGWWLYTQVSLPQPVRIVLAVIIAIVCILLLTQMLSGHSPVLRLR